MATRQQLIRQAHTAIVDTNRLTVQLHDAAIRRATAFRDLRQYMTLDQIGREFGISRQRVYQIVTSYLTD